MSEPVIIGHSMIRASAGSGKTYALVQRLLRLLALGVQPRSIVALTFTRKAAGEFFARLLQRLADFAIDPKGASEYLPEFGSDPQKRALELLRLLLGQMDKMRLGTLDSFYAAMVQSLPFELGLTGASGLMSGDEDLQAREEVLESLLVDLVKPENADARQELVEAWKLAALGQGSTMPVADMTRWLNALHEIMLECSDPTHWGSAESIWTQKESPVWRTGGDLAAMKNQLEERLVIEDFTASDAEEKWMAFYAALDGYFPGGRLNEDIEYMLDAKRGDVSLLPTGSGTWKIGRNKAVTLSKEVGSLLYQVLELVVGRELHSCVQRTKGRFRLVALYERAYQRLVRGRGRLRFSDLALLLSGKIDWTGKGVAAASDWQERWEMIRTDMEYRLDARRDHWMFDEFQDTSRRQWRVLENVVDEVLQDAEARRSFFAVGDLKQSIYLWRDAEPELFLGVEDRYRHHPLMKPGALHVSYRSSREVLSAVNDTFGNQKELSTILPGAMQWWQFEPHQAAEKVKEGSGYATLINAATPEDKITALIALIREVQPLERGWSCAVLVRTNDTARELSIRLRAELSCDVVCESEQAIATDNVAVLTLLSLMQLAAHPADTYAWEHLLMTPLGDWLLEQKKTPSIVGANVRHELRQGGFMAVAKSWTTVLRELPQALDDFANWRLNQFIELCAEFDVGGSRDVDAFLRFARNYRVPGPGGTLALQVMTLHKSKGLEFDMVILPELGAQGMDQAHREKLLIGRDEDGNIAWILEKPVTEILNWDGRLKEDVELQKSRAAFEGLCRLYVSMTRAKSALYLLTHSGRTPTAQSETGLLHKLLGAAQGKPTVYEMSAVADLELQCLYEKGSRSWFQTRKLRHPSGVVSLTPQVEAETVKLSTHLAALGALVVRRTPSGEEEHRMTGLELLSPNRERSRQNGLLVHGLFAEIEWLNGRDDLALKQLWQQSIWANENGYAQASVDVLQTLTRADVRTWFEKGETEAREVWRERSFDLYEDGEWISGQIDRVIIENDLLGNPISAVILDFKTDHVANADALQERAKGYLPQLRLYTMAVSRLTSLPLTKIRVGLVFVASSQLVWMKP